MTRCYASRNLLDWRVYSIFVGAGVQGLTDYWRSRQDAEHLKVRGAGLALSKKPMVTRRAMAFVGSL